MFRTSLRRAAAFQPSRPCFGAFSATAARQYSAAAGVADLDASKLKVRKTNDPRPLMKPEELVFGRNFTGNVPLLPPCQIAFINSIKLTNLPHQQTTCS